MNGQKPENNETTTLSQNFKDFLGLVRAMREAQADNFTVRTREALLKSKHLEVEVDRAIERYLSPQPELF